MLMSIQQDKGVKSGTGTPSVAVRGTDGARRGGGRGVGVSVEGGGPGRGGVSSSNSSEASRRGEGASEDMINQSIVYTLYLVGILFKFMLGLFTSNKSVISQSVITIWTNILLVTALTLNICMEQLTRIFQLAVTVTILGLLWQLSIVYKHYDSVNLNMVPSTYTNWNYLYNFLLLLFIGVVLGTDPNDDNKNKDNLLLVLSMLMFTTIIITHIILDFFMVDIYIK